MSPAGRAAGTALAHTTTRRPAHRTPSRTGSRCSSGPVTPSLYADPGDGQARLSHMRGSRVLLDGEIAVAMTGQVRTAVAEVIRVAPARPRWSAT